MLLLLSLLFSPMKLCGPTNIILHHPGVLSLPRPDRVQPQRVLWLCRQQAGALLLKERVLGIVKRQLEWQTFLAVIFSFCRLKNTSDHGSGCDWGQNWDVGTLSSSDLWASGSGYNSLLWRQKPTGKGNTREEEEFITIVQVFSVRSGGATGVTIKSPHGDPPISLVSCSVFYTKIGLTV